MDEEEKIKKEEGEEKMLDISDEAKELRAKLEESEKKSKEYLEGWQRAKADFLNYKSEERTRLEDLARYGTSEMLKDFITVLDSFDLAIATLEKQGPVEKGVYMIRAQIEDILRRRGLQKIESQAGKPFDPAEAEAIAEVESDLPAGTVVDEIESGYRLHEKILRPARVRVSKEKIET